MAEKDRLKLGIFFGGSSREREISFAGGRTVYDNIDESLFEAIPIFVDSFNNFILLNWENIYKGSIRDFFPSDLVKPFDNLYIESVCQSDKDPSYIRQVEKIGEILDIRALKDTIDFAFLCLHGNAGEDGSIQGLLEFYGIPYSGSGIFPSATGMDKSILNRILKEEGSQKEEFVIDIEEWRSSRNEKLGAILSQMTLPFVVRPANQGSSIGVNIVHREEDIESCIDAAFFQLNLNIEEWRKWSPEEKTDFLSQMADIRNHLGYPVLCADQLCIHPKEVFSFLENYDGTENRILLRATQTERRVLIEPFIEGREFSCIVIRDIEGNVKALPPTEIKKGKEVFDYRSKYLPGLSRKETPMQLPQEEVEKIQRKAEELYQFVGFNVYARIDGFYSTTGDIILNDPNTTSGMLPSSFFFHQAAEVGWTPSGFISYIIGKSIEECAIRSLANRHQFENLLSHLESMVTWKMKSEDDRKKIAVVLGGYSSERHISLESGRNIFEKLNGSSDYKPEPIFLTEENGEMKLFKIPMRLLLKDNADDIKISLGKPSSDFVKQLRKSFLASVERYQLDHLVAEAREINFEELAKEFDFAFIALHGRPGEDGALQKIFDDYELPFNGSPYSSAEITIDKFRTLEILREHGFTTASQMLVDKDEFRSNTEKIIARIESSSSYPIIAKPLDDGCSSAVKMIKDRSTLMDYLEAIFRDEELMDPEARRALDLSFQEEFPKKKTVLIEELITVADADHFMEITGGLLTHWDKNDDIQYQIFPPSESIAQFDILSIEEKFLAGEGVNITPPRYSFKPSLQELIDREVRKELKRAAKILGVEGYARIDAFVRIYEPDRVELIIIEVNSLPGMTPATAIFHQAAHEGLKPYELINKIIEFGFEKYKREHESSTY